MKKIIIIGSSGSGKSTLARELANILKLPLFHLDQLNWRPGWEEVPKEEQRALAQEVVTKEEWIIDGNYGETFDVRMKEADTILFLDFHRLICITRAFKRVITYRNRVRPDMAEGCPERFDLEFFKYIWNFPEQKTPHIRKRLADLPEEKQVIHFRKPREVERFLKELKHTQKAQTS
ncbi:DNA topology modulation protein [Chryseomicrobium palamuruense]|uniref:DNA topology modulation protein n=1 Tax=Chryseomicrobium palamuruense TaxID=682973 RepID=A0ABV8V054_9BACL